MEYQKRNLRRIRFVSQYKPDPHLSHTLSEPSTAQVLGTVANCDLNDIKSAIESADITQQAYHTSTTAAERGKLLRKWHDLVIANAEDRKDIPYLVLMDRFSLTTNFLPVSTILCLENGKTINEVKGEITYAASFIAWFAEEATRSYGDTIPSSTPSTMVLTLKEPVGVWNHHAVELSCGNDHTKGCSRPRCWVRGSDQAPKRNSFYLSCFHKVGCRGRYSRKCHSGVPYQKQISGV